MPSAQRKLYLTTATKLQSLARARQAKQRNTKLRGERARGRHRLSNFCEDLFFATASAHLR